ncbi:MAG: hypothetical protein PHE43_04550 [Candidatus Nanoarchaeia archaeon]|nr:hypothetical protein [Candidatus Nanoarchaeia archaeon]
MSEDNDMEGLYCPNQCEGMTLTGWGSPAFFVCEEQNGVPVDRPLTAYERLLVKQALNILAKRQGDYLEYDEPVPVPVRYRKKGGEVIEKMTYHLKTEKSVEDVKSILDGLYLSKECNCEGTVAHCCSTYSSVCWHGRELHFECSKWSDFTQENEKFLCEITIRCSDGKIYIAENIRCAEDNLACSGACPPSAKKVATALSEVTAAFVAVAE